MSDALRTTSPTCTASPIAPAPAPTGRRPAARLRGAGASPDPGPDTGPGAEFGRTPHFVTARRIVGAIDTVAVHAGPGPDLATGAVVPALCQSTTFAQRRLGNSPEHTYSRASNPTVSALEQALGALEDAPPAVCFRSGLAAITALFLTLLKQGDEVLVGKVVYGGTVRLLREILADLGIVARFVDTSDLDAVRQAIGPATRLVFAETPGNPTLVLTDVESVAAICRDAGVPLAVDNTFLTPVLHRPLDLGATVAVYSTTKYHDGHNTTVGGAVLSRDADLLTRLQRIRKSVGSIQAPREAAGITDGLVRLSVGLEDPDDLIADLDAAHRRASAGLALTRSTTVLKFGSSVLGSEADLPAAVHEIYRHVRRGERVVAIVSAIGDTTDRLLAKARDLGEGDPRAVAALLATGEQVSVALLGLALTRAGVPNETLEPARLGLRTTGPALEATPVDLETGTLRAALARVPVVVVPGFVGCDAAHGHTTLLGRGGSDLSAAFIADRLDAASTILLKDVDGVYTADPARTAQERIETAPCRYESIRWEEAIHVAAPLIQPRAVEHAATRGRSLEVRRPGLDAGTVVGAAPSRLAATAADRRPLRVAVLGAGVVGGGVIARLLAQPDLYELQAVLSRTPEKALAAGAPRHLLAADFEAVHASDAEVIVELVGGVEPAATWIERSLAGGRCVVTANKALLAMSGSSLEDLARASDACLLASAAVGGAAPVLETIERLRPQGIARIEAALSGTCNFVLDRLESGGTLVEALADARRAGLAEADPTLDVSGRDLLHKLGIIARRAGATIDPSTCRVAGIERVGAADLLPARRAGGMLRLVGRLDFAGPKAQATVGLETLGPGHPLVGLSGSEVGAAIRTTDGTAHVVRGGGAGRWPTTESVIADLLELRSHLRRRPAASLAAEDRP